MKINSSNSKSRLRGIVMLAPGLLAISAAQAAVTVAISNETGAAPFTPTYTVPMANNVLAGLAPSATTGATGLASFQLESSGGVGVLTDGSIGPILASGGANAAIHTIWATVGNGQGSGAPAGTSITYTLSSSTALSGIGVYGGWNDLGRDEQNFIVKYSTDGGTTYLDLVTVSNKPSSAGTAQPSALRSLIGDDTGTLAGGAVITNLQFVFGSGNTLGVENGWTGLSEITAYAAVPEPGVAALSLIGALGLLRRRRA